MGRCIQFRKVLLDAGVRCVGVPSERLTECSQMKNSSAVVMAWLGRLAAVATAHLPVERRGGNKSRP